MPKSNTETLIDETGNVSENLDAPVKKSRKGMVRGPSTVYVKYEVIDSSGTVVDGYKARATGATRDSKKIVNMTLNGNLDGLYMPVDVPNTAGA